MRDIQNSQCLLNVEYSGATCPHVTIQFGDTKDDVGLGLVKEGLVMVDVRKEKHLQKMVSKETAIRKRRKADLSLTMTPFFFKFCFRGNQRLCTSAERPVIVDYHVPKLKRNANSSVITKHRPSSLSP